MRNRHTGKINAFKQKIIDKGQKVVHNDKTYYGLAIGKRSGVTIVRVIN